MGKVERHLGVTIPFEQYGVTGYAKGYTLLDINLDEPIAPQFEKFLKVINLMDDVLVAVTDISSP